MPSRKAGLPASDGFTPPQAGKSDHGFLHKNLRRKMANHLKTSLAGVLPVVILLSTLAGCAAPEREPIVENRPAPESPPAPVVEVREKSNQELLDSALEFCQASNDFWEQGDLENAFDALDEAYSLILKVDPKGDSEILRQRDDLRITISKRIMEVHASRFTLANGNNKVIPLSMNENVKMALRLFKGRNRQFFLDSYRRSGKYRPFILQALKEARLPEELSWLPLIESGFKVRALSRARALGLWQFIASTGYKFGLKRDRWIDERMDPEKSTRAAIAYLKELHQIFGDWTTALAAYNCGEGRVLRVIESQKINYLDNFWDLYQQLPQETAFYVPQFLAVLHIINDPKAHGFILPEVEKEIETEEVSINKSVHVKAISQHIGVSCEVLKDLNPELRHDSTPNRPYAFKVPRGKGETLLSKLDHIPVLPPPPRYVIHRVRKGQVLSTIARRYKTSVRAIMRANRLRSSRYLKVGWRLKIPAGRRYVPAYKASPQAGTSTSSVKEVRYRVRKGDSLWKIANRFGTTTGAIRVRNNLKGTRMQIGQVIIIPKGVTTFKGMKTKIYAVTKGDSPYSIASEHQMSLLEFLRLNHLTPRSTIFPGQKLLVKEG
ncbi:MAG: LysM peptidoglycan-binding domain-containing protein [Deltaproteobacteria bacterium]|nr:LysM peptidoglycan-binding domain-containing protein [Deltaproteobacteria bacterium]